MDYYPGGSIMPGRSFNSNSYRFGYNAGSEKDDEIFGTTGSAYHTYFRELDTRINRWWGIDPKANLTPWESPYASMGNNPIWYNDPRGDYIGVPPEGQIDYSKPYQTIGYSQAWVHDEIYGSDGDEHGWVAYTANSHNGLPNAPNGATQFYFLQQKPILSISSHPYLSQASACEKIDAPR